MPDPSPPTVLTEDERETYTFRYVDHEGNETDRFWSEAEVAVLLADRVAAAVQAERERNRRRRGYCGCAWCCSTVPSEKRGETHQRTCQP